MRRFAPKRSLSKREQALESNRWDRAAAILGGMGREPVNQVPVPEKRIARERVAERVGASERQVLKAIRAALRLHPRVAFCWRMQSGLFTEGERRIGVGFKGLPDLVGALKGGRFFGIEVKREFGGTVSEAQENALQKIRDAGGIAGVAHSVDEALALIQ